VGVAQVRTTNRRDCLEIGSGRGEKTRKGDGSFWRVECDSAFWFACVTEPHCHDQAADGGLWIAGLWTRRLPRRTLHDNEGKGSTYKLKLGLELESCPGLGRDGAIGWKLEMLAMAVKRHKDQRMLSLSPVGLTKNKGYLWFFAAGHLPCSAARLASTADPQHWTDPPCPSQRRPSAALNAFPPCRTGFWGKNTGSELDWTQLSNGEPPLFSTWQSSPVGGTCSICLSMGNDAPNNGILVGVSSGIE
jgi:hypothetical protein